MINLEFNNVRKAVDANNIFNTLTAKYIFSFHTKLILLVNLELKFHDS